VRNVRSLIITNNHASSSNLITIQHYDGTTSVDIEKITLKAGESFIMSEDGEWRHLTAAGAEYEYARPDIPNYGITGTVAETYSRTLCCGGKWKHSVNWRHIYLVDLPEGWAGRFEH
jgi:hypothetical protein